jgi:hypothetical protein
MNAHTESGARRLDYFVLGCAILAAMTVAGVATALAVLP